MEANFTVLHIDNAVEDMGVIKLDMVKAEGKWAGWIEDEREAKKYEFYEIIGLI